MYQLGQKTANMSDSLKFEQIWKQFIANNGGAAAGLAASDFLALMKIFNDPSMILFSLFVPILYTEPKQVVDYLAYVWHSGWISDVRVYFSFEWLQCLANGMQAASSSSAAQYSTLVGSMAEIDSLFSFLNSTPPWKALYASEPDFLARVRRNIAMRPCAL
jgi:hypothetical protein